MNYRVLPSLMLLLGFLFFTFACSGENKNKEDEVGKSGKVDSVNVDVVSVGEESCAPILQAKCVQCHHLARICQNVGNKNKRSWKRTVKRMVNNGAKLTDEEQSILIDCLYSQADGVKEACK